MKGGILSIRQAWLLFADLNTRFNILIDECAHLQETINGFLEQGGHSVLGSKTEPEPCNRPWLAEPSRSTAYYSLPARERALINLWMSLGSLASGLEANQTTARRRFEEAVQAANRNEGDNGELYWFLSIRGYFLSEAFKFYTHQIEHAHEKLVQMLENTPGALPHPILLRRWNSATYGEFLSVYSRHVNWQTQTAIWTLAHGVGGESLHYFERWRSRTHLTHSWSHVPTSIARAHVFDRNHAAQERGKNRQDDDGRLFFGTIRSAYFYLEQPVLFPLLYHESAHLNFRAADQWAGVTPGKRDTFFTLRNEAAETLRRLANFDLPDEEYWNQFTEEVWADSVSIALCGKAYLAALVLQLFGLSGIRAFNQYDTEIDELIELSELGSRAREVREVAYPDQEDHYFWEARVKLACRLFRQLHFPCDQETSAWLESIESLIEAWRQSGKIVFARDATSSEHEIFWRHRAELNDWVVEVCDRCRSRVLGEFQSLRGIDRTYELDEPEIALAVEKAVNNYTSRIFSEADNSRFQVPVGSRLEDLSVSIRWYLSNAVAQQMKAANDSLTQLTGAYASYMRNDGSSAFRLGLEWCLARAGLYDAAADILADPDTALALDSSQARILKSAIELDTADYLKSGDRTETLDEIVGWLRRRKFATKPPYNGFRIYSLPRTHTAIREALKEAVRFLENFNAGGGQIRVGTLTLGVVRPWDMSSPDGQRSYGSSLSAASRYFDASLQLQREATKDFPQAGFDGRFYPLIGDYSYMSYLFGSTPVERDSHPVGSPKTLTKPRLVLQVYGASELPEPQSDRPLGRLSLLRFRYRWQWLDLARRLENDRKFSDASLFLSSAWEDAVLVSWHDDASDYWQSFTELGTDIRVDAVDSQSSVISYHLPATLPAQLSSEEKDLWRHDWVKALQARTLDGTNIARVINERTGRYDYTVVWGDGTKPCTLDRYMRIMESLPPDFWTRIGSITTSFERQTRPVANQFEFVSHVLLRGPA